MDSDLKREIILENYKNPNNRGLTFDKSYIKINQNNESCIDNFDIELKLEDGIIKDIRFDGEACAIATSSISISIGVLIGKTKEEALDIIENYENMIDGKDYDREKLKDLIIYEDIHKQPARVKCATLGILGIKNILKN